MSYKVKASSGAQKDAANTVGYKILDNGVLQLVEVIDRTKKVLREYSPGAWEFVEGTRLLDDTTRSMGADGTISQGLYNGQS